MMTAKEAAAKSEASYESSLNKYLKDAADSISCAAEDGKRSCSVLVPNIVLNAVLEELVSKGYTPVKSTASRVEPTTMIPISW